MSIEYPRTPAGALSVAVRADYPDGRYEVLIRFVAGAAFAAVDWIAEHRGEYPPEVTLSVTHLY